VGYRELLQEKRFSKYEVVRLRARKHGSDHRRETWTPDTNSIERGEFIKPGGAWLARRELVEPLLGPTMCQLHRGRRKNGPGPSLGLVRPSRVRGLRVTLETEWSSGQLGTVGQGNLLTSKTELVKPHHAFSYRYDCEEPGCKGHTQKIVDWEHGESYRSWPQTGEALVDAITAKWLGMCEGKREPFFFVGDQHMRPGQFLVLGVFYPERRPPVTQLTFNLAA
jgi:hypothetical protein